MTFSFKIPDGRTTKLRPFTLRELFRLTRLSVHLTTKQLAWFPSPPKEKRRSLKLRPKLAKQAYGTLGQLGLKGLWRPPVRASPQVRPLPPPSVAPGPREALSRGTAPPMGPPDGDGETDDSGGEGPPPSPARPRRSRGRGRPRKVRRFRAHPNSRTYRARLSKLDAVAGALEGDPTALFVTLAPPAPPDDRARRLAAVPADTARAFAALAAKLRRAGATFALAVATRADSGAFHPHAHLLVGGVSPARLRVLAARSGLSVSYAEPLRNPQAGARYLARAGQKAPYDGILGGRGYYAHVPARPVSSRNTTPGEIPPPEAVPAGLELAPGQRIADPAVFLGALARDLEARISAVRDAARHRLALLRAALAERGPP